MLLNPDRYWWLIPASFTTAFLWQFWPLSQQIRMFAPDAIVLTTLYWTLRRPMLVNSGWAFVVGLVRDAIEGTPLGMHALALVVVSYIVQLLNERMRQYAIWQQAIVVGLLYTLYLLIGNWVELLDNPDTAQTLLWPPALATGLAWPFGYLLLRQLEEGSLRAPVRS